MAFKWFKGAVQVTVEASWDESLRHRSCKDHAVSSMHPDVGIIRHGHVAFARPRPIRGHIRPISVGDAETPEILPLPPQGARAGMDPNAARGHHRHMHVAWWGCQRLTLHLGPLSGLKIKAPQLIKLRVATVAAVNPNCFVFFIFIFMVQSYMVHACAWPRIGIGAFIAPFFGPEVEVPEFRQHANAIAVTCPSELRERGSLHTMDKSGTKQWVPTRVKLIRRQQAPTEVSQVKKHRSRQVPPASVHPNVPGAVHHGLLLARCRLEPMAQGAQGDPNMATL